MGAVYFSTIFSSQFFSLQWHQDEPFKLCQKGYVLFTYPFWLTFILVSRFLSYTYLACFLLLLPCRFWYSSLVYTFLLLLLAQTLVLFISIWKGKFICNSLYKSNLILHFFLVWTLISTFMFSKKGNKIRCKTNFIGKRRVQLISK